MKRSVQELVEQQSGNGFNEKFENMVLYCTEKEPDIKKRVAEQEKRLKLLNERISDAQSIVQDIDRMKYQVEAVIRTASTMVDKTE